ncbi:MAG TPA: hypothetical protein VF322_01460 [Gammaproteobacteria bacterium]
MRGINTPRRRTAARVAGAAVGAVALLGLAAGSSAQSGQDYMPQATLVEVMSGMVMPFAQVVWDAVIYDETIHGPDTDEGWQEARNAAVALAESANVLVIPGRKVAGPDKMANEGELAPEEIEALIAKNRGAWVGHAHALHEVATQAIAAIDARDANKLSDVSGALDSVCEGCHLQFWYPNQQQL